MGIATMLKTPETIRTLQRKLYRKAKQEPACRFHALYDKVYRADILSHAYALVRANKGSAGIDGVTFAAIEEQEGVTAFIAELEDALGNKTYKPDPVKRVMIPKADGSQRPLGIPTIRDRVAQMATKLVIEPIFEADFLPCSYGFRPHRRAQDAISEIRYPATPTRNYQWVFEADIKACFDNIEHTALMRRVARRIGDGRILALVRAFLRAGVLAEDGKARETITGTPQGGILSPLLANIALSVLDEHFTQKWEALGPSWQRAKLRRAGVPAMRLVRYADDFVVMVNGQQADAEALRQEVEELLAPIGLSLSVEKTRICHIDEGFDFLGWHIQRRRWRGRNGKQVVYTYPSKKALASVMAKVRSLTRRDKHRTLGALLRAVNRVLRGWCEYFRYGVSARTFSYLGYFTWHRVFRWLRKRHLGIGAKKLVRRLLPDWQFADGRVSLFRPQAVSIIRYRYRGAKIPTPWALSA